jgi:hypothetical protein
MALDLDDEITGTEDLIDIREVRGRIERIHPFHVEDSRTGPGATPGYQLPDYTERADAQAWIGSQNESWHRYLVVIEYAHELAELAELGQLERTMVSAGATTAIRTNYLGAFARDEIASTYGQDAVTALDRYLNWDLITYHRARDLAQTTFRGTRYYLTA